MQTHRATPRSFDAGSARGWRGASLLAGAALLGLAGCDVLWQPYVTTFDGEPLAGQGLMPTRCAELQQLGNLDDAEYTLYLDGDSASPYTAYCHNMAATPTEYLTLSAAPQANVARYSLINPGANVTTEYHRVRFDPKTRQLLCDDQTFAGPSRGYLVYGGMSVTSVPFGVAIACLGSAAMGRIDLTGTAFAVADQAIERSGGNPGASQASYSMNNQVVTLAAQGSCGHLTPAPVVSAQQQLSRNSGQRLQLTYLGR